MKRYVTKSILEGLRALEQANGFHFSHALSDDYIAKLDPTVRLPVVKSFLNEGKANGQDVIRVELLIPKNGKAIPLAHATVDMSYEVFKSLPSTKG